MERGATEMRPQRVTEPFMQHTAATRFGIDLEVPTDRSMLDVLEAAGVGVLADCRRGECGLCAMDVVSVTGTIDHRDVFFSDHEHEEGRRICACVSRVVGGGIVVDPAFRGDDRLKPGREAFAGSIFEKA